MKIYTGPHKITFFEQTSQKLEGAACHGGKPLGFFEVAACHGGKPLGFHALQNAILWVPEGPPGGLSHEIAFSGGRNEILMSHSEYHLIGGDPRGH